MIIEIEKQESGKAKENPGIERFIENLMLYLLENLDAKDRNVRLRLCQVLVACVNGVDELSDSVWMLFRVKMVERLFDKEPSIRVQAVHATARLQVLKT